MEDKKESAQGLDKVEPSLRREGSGEGSQAQNPISYDEVTEIFPGLNVRFREAGYIRTGASNGVFFINDSFDNYNAQLCNEYNPYDT